MSNLRHKLYIYTMTMLISLFIIMVMGFSGYGLNAQAKSSQALSAPEQLSPADKTLLTNFPRSVTLKWKPVTGATAYEVEIDCFQCRTKGQWDSQNGSVSKFESNISGTAYTFVFFSDNQGRWRVRASNGGQKSPWSSWWQFEFNTKKRP